MANAEQEKETPKKIRPRPIVRLGIFLISHSLFFSVICCIAGVLALLLLPVLAKNTYISENALMPGSASSMLSNHDILQANKLVEDLYSCNLGPEDKGIEGRGVLARYMLDMGAEVSYHKFHPQLNQFHPLHFFSNPDSGIMRENFSCSPYGINTVGIIRAPRGDGKEAIVLVTPYNFGKSDPSEALSLGIAYSVFSLLSRVTWLAKDIIWLVADSQYGEYVPVAAWLRDYHTPAFTGLASVNADACLRGSNLYVLEENYVAQRKIYDGFRHAGTMAAALVVKVTDRNELWDDTLSIYPEALNGQMPNLDLINVVNYLAVHRQGLHVKVQKLWSQLNLKWLEILGKVFEFIGKEARSLNPNWKFGIPAADYIEGAVTLASSLYHQALGIPTGPHGAFRDFQVDAITLEISPKVSSNNKARRNQFILRGGRLIEGVIRSVNNLLEKFHQSFFLYLLTSPSKFVSVGVYMIAFALLVAPLPLVAASLYADANKLDLGLKDGKSTCKVTESNKTDITKSNETEIMESNERNINGSNVTSKATESNETDVTDSNEKDITELKKDITFRPWKWVNAAKEVFFFHIWEIGALIIVPTCLMAHPLKLDIRTKSLGSFLRLVCNLILGFIALPPVAFFLSKGIIEGNDSINVGDFWSWVESLWAWNSATYIYVDVPLVY
ncbi:conserved hypothetical protein [Ricinus communis]|uniref:Uncharacterized protein n=1 Tax=Ricinus communis TaxID=3988 RepID=B9S648_RICCO|nr:conserved hypothetical protein [Ricinus communis]